MATVSKRTDGGRTGYLVRWRDEAGKQRAKSFKRKVDADRFRTEVEHSLNSGSYVDPRDGRVTVREVAEKWRANKSHRPNTAMRVKSQLEKHIYPMLGSRPIAAVKPPEVEDWLAGLRQTLAPGSVRTVFATLSAVFAEALRHKRIAVDPTVGIELPKVHRTRVVPLTVAQVEALIEALPERYRIAAVVAAGAGLRQGEVFGLQVADVDIERRSIHVRRQMQPHGVDRLKNDAADRVIPVGSVVIEAVTAHLAAYPAAGAEHVVRTPAGEPAHRAIFADTWRSARRSAGLPEAGMHDLRHFYASALIRAGLSVKVVSDRLGHSNAAMTLNVYSHLWPDDEDRTRQAIDDLFRAPAGA